MKSIYINLGLILAPVVLFIIFIIIPYYNKIALIKEETYDERVQLEIYKQQRNNAELTRADYNKIKNDTENISKIFINKANILDFVSDLESIASQYQLQQTIKINTDLKSDDNTPTNFTISTVGNWEGVWQYLLDLEAANYYVNISQITLADQNDTINLNYTATIYNQ